ncbi:hypothetical protein BANRA_05936 [Pseudomonas aeruginosa]|nr:hypothetical protein BANRA_05936 [Pseudomonas aeruginosa]
MLLSVAIQGWPALSLASLLVGRLVLGAAESLVGSAAIGWGIGRVGAPHTAKVISWNGIASYGAIALGAPLGVLLVQWLGLWSMGASIVLLGALGFALAWPKLPAPLVHGERRSTMCSAGSPRTVWAWRWGRSASASIATFITLYYASRGWANAVLCLSAFGGCFIGARLLFANSINRLGGFRVAIICLGVESLGLLLLWSAPNPWVGLAGAALRLRLLPGVPGVRRGSGEPGTGFQPWRGAGRLLAVRRPVAGHHRAAGGLRRQPVRLPLDVPLRLPWPRSAGWPSRTAPAQPPAWLGCTVPGGGTRSRARRAGAQGRAQLAGLQRLVEQRHAQAGQRARRQSSLRSARDHRGDLRAVVLAQGAQQLATGSAVPVRW